MKKGKTKNFQETNHMNKQDYILLFNCIHPNFFERKNICSLPDEKFFDEMILPLNKFDMHKYGKNLDDNNKNLSDKFINFL